MKRKMEWVSWGVVMAWGIAAIWPASFWYDAGTFRMPDYVSGVDAIEIAYAGGVHRDFKGSYVVIVRSTVDSSVVIEDASGIFQYRADAVRPDPLTIDWWARRNAADIRNLPAGDYTLETCWTVRVLSWLPIIPSKITCHDPALFHVYAPGDSR